MSKYLATRDGQTAIAETLEELVDQFNYRIDYSNGTWYLNEELQPMSFATIANNSNGYTNAEIKKMVIEKVYALLPKAKWDVYKKQH